MIEEGAVAGMFEIFLDADAAFRFQLTAPDGSVLAVSRAFPDKEAVIKGIAAAREYAGTGHVRELPRPGRERPSPRQAAVPVAAMPDKRRSHTGHSDLWPVRRASGSARPRVSTSANQSPGA
ncbi:YegP family protein [Arthrobacter sp. D1-17]